MCAETKYPVPIVCPNDLGELQTTGSGYLCSVCGQVFSSFHGIVELLPRETLQATSPESLQLTAYRATFSTRANTAWRHFLGTWVNQLGNAYLYSWATRNLERRARGRSLSVLDAACGDGILLRYLPARHRYVGIDFSSRPLLCAQRFRPASYFRADLNHLPFPDGTFDAVVSLQALQYLSKPAQALAQIARVLKPGGSLVLTVPNDESLKYRFLGIPKIQLQRFNRRSLPEMLGHHFKILDLATRGLWLPAPKVSFHVPGIYPVRWGLSWTVVAEPKK